MFRAQKRGRFNAVLVADTFDPAAIFIVAHESCCEQRKIGPHDRDIYKDVEGRSAGAFDGRRDVGQRILLGPHINHFYCVNYPVSARENAVPIIHSRV